MARVTSSIGLDQTRGTRRHAARALSQTGLHVSNAGTPSLTIGIDARAAAEVSAGRGRVVRELLLALAARHHDGHRYLLYTRSAWPEAALDDRFQWRSMRARDPWWHVLAARAANRECDVFLSSNSYLTTWFLRVPAVPIVYDMTTFEPSMRPNRRSTIIEHATLGFAVRRSAAFLAISQATADALIEHYPSAASRTVVAPLGVAPALLRPSGSTPATTQPLELAALPQAGFVLAVGTLEPRKNLPRLVDAYRRLPGVLRSEHPLVVVGALGWETGETLAALEGLGENCVRLGYVSDAALAELYHRCAVFCYPSLGEGFGLPVLEAMAAGAAVLTSNVSSLPEVGGEAVAYADPRDTGDIARALGSLLEDQSLRARLAAEARERARQFTWERFAELTLGALQNAARSRR
jgi:glycosyltransferase involved in cell wall biosynthesis